VAACRTEKNYFAHVQVGVIRDLIGGGKASGNIILIAIPKVAFACAFPMLPIPFRPLCVKSLYVPPRARTGRAKGDRANLIRPRDQGNIVEFIDADSAGL
jgi:hypothetical protein